MDVEMDPHSGLLYLVKAVDLVERCSALVPAPPRKEKNDAGPRIRNPPLTLRRINMPQLRPLRTVAFAKIQFHCSILSFDVMMDINKHVTVMSMIPEKKILSDFVFHHFFYCPCLKTDKMVILTPGRNHLSLFSKKEEERVFRFMLFGMSTIFFNNGIEYCYMLISNGVYLIKISEPVHSIHVCPNSRDFRLVTFQQAHICLGDMNNPGYMTAYPDHKVTVKIERIDLI